MQPITVGGTVIGGNSSLSSDGLTLTFTPAVVLPPSTTNFRVLVSGFTDRVGNAVVPFNSSFTTSSVIDTTSPSVTAINPQSGSTGVAINSAVVLTFSEAVDPTSVNASSIRVSVQSTGASIPGSYTVNGAVVTYSPVAAFPPSTRILVLVNGCCGGNTVRDLAGNGAGYYSSTFDTLAAIDTTPPQVTLVTPGNGAANIGPNAPVVLTFSKPLDPQTINSGNFGLLAGSTVISSTWVTSSDNRTVTMTSMLPPASTITVVATHDVQDLSGNHLADFRSQFTTAAQVDSGAPSVVAQRPGNGGVDVPLSAPLSLFTSKPLNAATVNGALRVSQNGVLVSGNVEVIGGGQVIQFTPATAWQYSALIQVFLDSTARDLSGNTFFNYQASFRTVADPAVTAPYPVRYSIPYGTASLNPVVEVEFSGALDPATVNNNTVTFYSAWVLPPGTAGQTIINLRGDRVVRIVPSAPLLPNWQYCYYGSNNSIRNPQGLAVQGFSSCFVTGTATDTVAPQIVAVSPPDGASGVGVSAGIGVRFDKPVNQLMVNGSTVQVSGGGVTLVPYTISFGDQNRYVQIVPYGMLPSSALMTINISGIEDLSGNLVAPRTTQFQTGLGPDLSALTLVRTNPPSEATNVPVNTVLSLEFNRPVDPLTVNATNLVVGDIAGTVAGSYSVSSDGRTAMFVPNLPWGVGRLIYVRYGGIQDLSGNYAAPPTQCCWSPQLTFTVSFTPDTVAPQVVQVSPDNGLTGVPINAQIMIAFNEPVQASSTDLITLSRGGIDVGTGRVLSNGNLILTLIPTFPLDAFASYSVSIAGVKDLAGNNLPTVIFSFATGSSADLVQPSVSLNPPNGAIGIGTNVVIAAQFSEPINPITANGSTFRVIATSTGLAVLGTLTISPDGQSVTFAAASGLMPGTQYSVQLSGITDLAGNQSTYYYGSVFTTTP